MAGMDPMRFLESDDPVEVIVMLSIARRWYERRLELDRQLAVEVNNVLAKSSGGN